MKYYHPPAKLVDIEIGDPVSYRRHNGTIQRGTIHTIGKAQVKLALDNRKFSPWLYPVQIRPDFAIGGSPTGPIKIAFQTQQGESNGGKRDVSG